jgi:methyltransferase family protein
MQKLTGEKYLNYWRDRIAKGPEQVGRGGSTMEEVEKQGDLYFDYIRRGLSGVPKQPKIENILEFGSGWGRMLVRCRSIWPDAKLTGIELCPTAAGKSWLDSKTTILTGCEAPASLFGTMDFAFTCTVLQHITDPEKMVQACVSLYSCLKKGGALVLLENVESTKAEHVLGVPAQVYMDQFPTIEWQEEFSIVKYADERHAVMVGKKV